MSTAIEFNHVSKQYRLGKKRVLLENGMKESYRKAA